MKVEGTRSELASLKLVLKAALVLGILWVVVEHVRCALATPHEGARRTKCAGNLKQIGYACHLYSGDHRDRFPPGLGTLFPKYIPDGNVYVCPTSFRATAHTTKKGTPFGAGNADYCYVSGLRDDDPEGYVLAFDEEWDHPRKRERGKLYRRGLNVLYVGGNVEWETDFDALHEKLGRQEQELAAKGRSMEVLRPAWSRWPDPPAGAGRGRFPWRIALAWGVALVALAAAATLAMLRRLRRGSGG